jgi:hypothetical protein
LLAPPADIDLTRPGFFKSGEEPKWQIWLLLIIMMKTLIKGIDEAGIFYPL